MFYLIIDILITSIMSIGFKFAAVKKWNSNRILFVNYAVAAVVSLSSFVREAGLQALKDPGKIDFSILLQEKTVANSILISVVIGIILGTIYMLNLNVQKNSICFNGATITSFFGSTGFVGGTVLSMIAWHELPTLMQIVSIILILICLALNAGNFKAFNVQKPLLLLCQVTFGAFSQFFYKVFTMYALAEYKSFFLLVVFTTAFIAAGILNKPLTGEFWKDIFTNPRVLIPGVIIGAANSVAAIFRIKALGVLPASVVYPSQAAGGLMFVFLASKVIFHEKTNKREILALTLAVISLILANLK